MAKAGEGPKRKKRTTTTVEEELRDREEIEAAGQEIPVADLDPSVEQVLAQLGEEAAKVYLERRGRRDRRWSMVDTIYADEFTLENVKAAFGGGEYRARIVDSEGNYLKARTFYIEGKEKYPEPEAEQPPTGEAATVVLLREVLQELRQPRTVGPVEARDPLEMSIKMVEVIMAAISPMLAAVKSGGDDSDPWSPFDRGLELGERLGGVLAGRSEGDSMVAKLAGEVLGVLRDSRKGAGAAAGQPGAAPPVNVPDEAPMWVKRFAQFVPMVQQLAAEGRQPDLYAALILDRVDGATASFLADQLAGRGQQFVDEFYRFFPMTAPFKEWYDALFTALSTQLVGEAEEDERLPEIGGAAIPGDDAERDS